MKYVCDICGYVYDPEIGDPDNGVAPGTPWEEVPEDWVCPLCARRQRPVQRGRISLNLEQERMPFLSCFFALCRIERG